MTALMQHASLWTSSWVSLQQVDTQTAVNETESKTQTVNTQSSSLKVVRQTFQCWCRVLTYCGLILSYWSWNELIINKMQRLSFDFVDVNFVKFKYSMGIEDRIYICFAMTHLSGQDLCGDRCIPSCHSPCHAQVTILCQPISILQWV